MSEGRREVVELDNREQYAVQQEKSSGTRASGCDCRGCALDDQIRRMDSLDVERRSYYREQVISDTEEKIYETSNLERRARDGARDRRETGHERLTGVSFG